MIAAARITGRVGNSGHRPGSAGFTLTEVVVAVALFVLGTLGAFGLASAVLRLNVFSQRTTEATTLAGNKLEELFACPSANVRPGTNAASGYTVVWTLTNNAALNTRTIRISVQWQDPNGNLRQVAMNGIRTD